ncbi:HAMP domain-containing histidine kinase [Patescibacteria group bacterium]|nr:HAMP domain-containing histidine kinase [Patescibacteria group bacterium]MCL5091254.1 HAMP domain-containing histidine kinase [Patescibacteria group bacterium]
MSISGLFSLAFYNASTREIRRIVIRTQSLQSLEQQEEGGFFFLPPPHNLIFRPPSTKELQATEKRLKVILVAINGIIFLMAGGAGYFLAGRTLRPIRLMVEEQNQFISNASHELRTPIATMRAEMEGSLLEKNITDQHARELIKSNLEELSSLQNLSNSLLRLTTTHTFVEQPSLDIVSLSEVIKTAYKKVLPLAKKRRICVRLTVKDGRINGDRKTLVELFVILFDNAIKYSPEAAAISVASEYHHNRVKISVKDQGIGIAAADLPHIFERFYRADKSRSKVDGYGLGLAIAKKIVQAHLGSISVISQPKKGSAFTVELPVASA